MYIDPNTGGIVFQALTALTVFGICGMLLTAVGGAIAGVYFIWKGKKKQPTDSNGKYRP